MTRDVRRTLAGCALGGLIAAGAAAVVMVPTSPTVAQAQVAMKTFANEQYRYTVALPAGCRHEEGPGTVDAVCSADLNPERSAQVNLATALILEVGAEIVSANDRAPVAELAQRFGEAAFRDELPESVCGESDKSRASIDNVKQISEDARLTYTADVTCAEVRFLQIGERRASVRYILAPDARYRLIARAPSEDFEKQKQAIDAFFESFRVLPSRK